MHSPATMDCLKTTWTKKYAVYYFLPWSAQIWPHCIYIRNPALNLCNWKATKMNSVTNQRHICTAVPFLWFQGAQKCWFPRGGVVMSVPDWPVLCTELSWRPGDQEMNPYQAQWSALLWDTPARMTKKKTSLLTIVICPCGKSNIKRKFWWCQQWKCVFDWMVFEYLTSGVYR